MKGLAIGSTLSRRSARRHTRSRGARRLPWRVVGLLAFLAPAAAGQVLDPKTYASPSGSHELLVDPTSMRGSGPARYRMTQEGELVWEGERPFSLWDAVVNDDGQVLGYAYERGVTPEPHGVGYHGLSVCRLDGEGRIRLRDRASSHEGGTIRPGSYGDSPRVRGLLLDPERDRFVVRLPAEWNDPPERWWVYRASTGERLEDVIPSQPLVERGFVTVVSADLVPGTPLALLHWNVLRLGNGISQDTVLTLVDPRGREVWRLDLPGESEAHRAERDLGGDRDEGGTVRVELAPRRLDVRSRSLSARISYRVEEDEQAGAGWRVVETERVGDAPPVRVEVDVPELDTIELEALGTIELQGVDRVLGPSLDDELPSIARLTVAPDGRIFALNERTATVHVFGPDGVQERLLRRREPPSPVESFSNWAVVIDGEGNLFYPATDGEGHVGFSPDGFPIVPETAGIAPAGGTWMFQPSRRVRWVLGRKTIALVAPGGRVLGTIERRPDGRWLQEVRSGAVAPDGSLAVVATEESPVGLVVPRPAVACLYGPEGAPLRTLPLTGASSFADVAFTGSLLIAAERETVLLYDVDGGPPRRLVLPGGAQARWLPFVVHDGRELWLLGSRTRTLHRYRLP